MLLIIDSLLQLVNMNKNKARSIAETITNQELLEMFKSAKLKIVDWAKRSKINTSLTRGTAWNILAKNFDIEKRHIIIVKTNMIREFGEFLPKKLMPVKKKRPILGRPHHQEPDFSSEIFH